MDIKPPKVDKAPKPVKWKLYKGERADIPSPFGGLVKVTNEDLENPKVIAMLTQVEKLRGIRLFGTVFVQE